MYSKIIQGCMRIGNKSISDIHSLILKDIECGINFFDHADIYGSGDNKPCETIFGETLKAYPELREKIIIQSKCGIITDPDGSYYDSSYEHIIKEVRQSIERLHCSYLDFLLIHRPDILTPIEEINKAFVYLKKEGLVRHFGVSNFSLGQLSYYRAHLDVEIEVNQLQLSLGHTLILDDQFYTNLDSKNWHNSNLFDYCRENNIIIQAWSPFQFGFFSGTFIDDYDNFKELNEEMDKLVQKYNTNKNAIAVSFLLAIPSDIQVIVGTTNLNRIEGLKNVNELKLTRKEWYKLYSLAGHQLP